MKKIKTDPLKTVLTITLGFTIIYLLTFSKWSIIVALTVGLGGLFFPYLAKKINTLWMGLAYILSFIVPNIILAIIYFIVLFPLSMLRRMLGKKNPLVLKNDTASIFVITNKTFNKEGFEKPW